jgi:primosomal protein N'
MSSNEEEVIETTTMAVTNGMSLSSYVIAIVVGGVIAAAYYYFVVLKNQKKDTSKNKSIKDVDIDDPMANNSVGINDIAYIASKLKPDSTPLDILLAVASSPESIEWGTKAHLKRQTIIQERLEEDKNHQQEKKKEGSSNKSSSSNSVFDLDDDGWADDDEDLDDEEAKEKAKLAKKAEEDKKKAREELKKVTEKPKYLLEGIDGVIGQQWVEATLAKAGAWPLPDMRFLDGMTFEYEGKQVSALDHPGLRRNLCHIAGRINSVRLNSHPELSKFGGGMKMARQGAHPFSVSADL